MVQGPGLVLDEENVDAGVGGDGNGRSFDDSYRGDFETGAFEFPSVITSTEEVLDFPDRFADVLETDDETRIEGNLEDFDAQEVTYAGYVMTEVTLTDRLLLLPGVRYEFTDVESEGLQAVVEDGDIVGSTPETATNDYGYFFPMLHARFAVTPQTNSRAAVTIALARPDFFDLASCRWVVREGFVATNRVANIPNADLGRSNTLRFDVEGSRGQGLFLRPIRVAAGGRDLYATLDTGAAWPIAGFSTTLEAPVSARRRRPPSKTSPECWRPTRIFGLLSRRIRTRRAQRAPTRAPVNSARRQSSST